MHKKQDLGNTTASEFWQDNDYDQVGTYYIMNIRHIPWN